MHSGPLGVLEWLEGSTLWELMSDGIMVGSEGERLKELWQAILGEYEALDSKHRLNMLTLPMFYHGEVFHTKLKIK